MDSSEVQQMLDKCERQIEQLENQLKHLKSVRVSLKKVLEAPPAESSPANRFQSQRPLIATKQVLTERGEPIPLAELRQILLDGGIAIGKKRGVHNVNKSIEISVGIGELTSTGKDQKIGLPEWSKKR